MTLILTRVKGDSIVLWIVAIVAIVISLIALFKQAHPKI